MFLALSLSTVSNAFLQSINVANILPLFEDDGGVVVLDRDLDQHVANHPFTGIDATIGGAQFVVLFVVVIVLK